MLRRPHRLVQEKDFQLIYKYGRTSISRLIILRFLKNNKGKSRFGFIVGNKISKKSTLRNRIKRYLREIVRNNLKQIKSGYDYILIARQAIIGKKYREIKQEIDKLFIKSGQIT